MMARLPFLVLPVILALAGCAEDETRSVVLLIESPLEVPTQFNSIKVTFTASRTPEGNVCWPVTRPFPIDAPGDLPFRAAAEMGAEYSEWVAYRVQAFLGGAEVYDYQARLPWPSGRREISVRIGADCYAHHCEPDFQCYQGECVLAPDPDVFDSRALWDPGVSCDRAAAVEDAGTGDTADAGGD